MRCSDVVEDVTIPALVDGINQVLHGQEVASWCVKELSRVKLVQQNLWDPLSSKGDMSHGRPGGVRQMRE